MTILTRSICTRKRKQLDGLKRLGFKMIREWKFMQLRGNEFGANWIHIIPEGKVHVGVAYACLWPASQRV